MHKTFTCCLVLSFALVAGPLSGDDKQVDSKPEPNAGPKAKADAKPESIDPQQVAKWIAGLDAEEFEDRQDAVTALVKAGGGIIDRVEQAARGKSLEMSYRAIIVLRELALSLDDSASREAEEALRRLSQPGGTGGAAQLVRQFAGPALLALTQQKYQRAMNVIQKNGGRFTVGVYGKRLDNAGYSYHASCLR